MGRTILWIVKAKKSFIYSRREKLFINNEIRGEIVLGRIGPVFSKQNNKTPKSGGIRVKRIGVAGKEGNYVENKSLRAFTYLIGASRRKIVILAATLVSIYYLWFNFIACEKADPFISLMRQSI